jgi:hypothetical protein
MQKKVESGKDSALIENIVKAKRLSLPVSAAVSNQFDCVYKEARRKNLKLPERSAKRRLKPTP